MTALLEQAIETVRGLPDEAQDAVAQMLLELVAEDLAAADRAVVALTADEAASFDESLAQGERGEPASDEAVRSVWAKYGPRDFAIQRALSRSWIKS